MRKEDNITYIHEISKTSNSDDSNIDIQEKQNIPYPLMQYITKLGLGAILCLIVALTCAITYRTFMPLVLLLGTTYFVFEIIRIYYNFDKDNIAEVPVLCTGVKPSSIRDRVIVTFREVGEEDTDDEETAPSSYKFIIPSRKTQDEFMVNCAYLIYFDKNNPDMLLAWANI